MAELRLVFVVGEASGDTLAAAMVDGIRACGHDVTLSGIGGPRLQDRGLSAVAPMESLTVIGIGQALAAVPQLNRLADQLIAHVIETRPDAIITVDSKGFNLRFARRLRARLKARSAEMVPPVIHTVAPTVWAWGGWRAASVARSVDRLICLFPFETLISQRMDWIRCRWVIRLLKGNAPAVRKPAKGLASLLMKRCCVFCPAAAGQRWQGCCLIWWRQWGY